MNYRPLLSLASSTAALIALLVSPLHGQTTIQRSAEREIARRQAGLQHADQITKAGDKAMLEKDFETAFTSYRSACDALVSSPLTESSRKQATIKFADAGVKLAEQRIAEGRMGDATTVLQTVLEASYAPDHKEASTLLSRIQEPGYYNTTITPRFAANVEEVKKLMTEAQGFYDTGRYDLAFKRYEQVLNIDPYNIAARKGQENVHLARANYAGSAYNETRARALWKVDKAWENPVKKFGITAAPAIQTQSIEAGNIARITNKLNSIIIPKIDIKDGSLQEVVDHLRDKSKELDVAEPDPAKRGVNIFVSTETGGASVGAPAVTATVDATIPGLEAAPAVNPAPEIANNSTETKRVRRLNLSGVPLATVLKLIADDVAMKVKIDPFYVAIVPLSTPTDVLISRTWKVPPTFLTSAPGGAPAANALDAGAPAGGEGKGLPGRAKAKDVLEANGITFPPGSSANYLASTSELVVRNTQENIDAIETVVESLSNAAPTQVNIEAKFIEITQQNLKELSFDWLLGPFNIPGTDRVFGGGGSSGTSPKTDQGNFPSPVGQTNPITAGNRSGNNAISQNAIDSLLYGGMGATAVAPGVLSLAGVFTDPQFQVVIRALNQKKGVDLLSSPSVTAKSGEQATIEIIREFIYPTEFDPPQIPQTFGGAASGDGDTFISTFPVTPTTPSAFMTRNTGVTMAVSPVVGPDGQTIDLQLEPQVVEFEGFINYGSPIKTVNPSGFGVLGSIGSATGMTDSSVVLTDNVINQPIFSTRKVKTSVSVWDGSTVVLGGLMREDVQKVEDKVPLLGDIPLLGRAFRSSVDQHMKRNLVIFVTARLINPAGDPLKEEEEKEEVVEPLGLPEGITPPALPEAPLFPK